MQIHPATIKQFFASAKQFTAAVRFIKKLRRFLSKPAAVSKVRREAERRTGSTRKSHEDSSTASTKQFAAAVRFGYSTLFPFTCILCNHTSQRNQDLCEPCYQTLPLLKQGCLCCAIPLPDNIGGSRCGHCLQKTPPFDVTHALYEYQLPITKLILELKFKQELINARILGEHLAHAILQWWYPTKPLPKIIIPMPLHAARLKERGFNQALEMARPIAKALKLPLNTSCQRNKSTMPQSMLSAAQRQKNVKGAFTVMDHFRGQHVAVIDDVITTGNTITEFCKTLKQNGAGQIDVWCCARVC